MDERSESLDLIRGLAALFVMIGHLRSVFFLPLDDLENVSIFYRTFYFITGYGHECVIIFFVLSGYFVGAAFHRGFSTTTLGNRVANYSINRMARLWVVLLPALMLTLLLDNIGMLMTIDKSIYATDDYFRFIPLSNDRSILTFLGNVFFLQTIEVTTFGTNAPLWSLANEFWYYVMFPLLYLAFVKGISTARKLLVAGVFIVILGWLGLRNLPLAIGFAIWLMGYGAYLTAVKPVWIIRATCILLFIASLVMVRIMQLPYEDVALGIFTSLFVISVRDIRLPRLKLIADFLSRISYTLYLIHLPIIVFLSATVFYGYTLKNDVQSIIIFLGQALGLIAVSYSFYYLFERNTDRVRHYVRRVLCGS